MPDKKILTKADLTDEELAKIAGGQKDCSLFFCSKCGQHMYLDGDLTGQTKDCPYCDKKGGMEFFGILHIT